jgi:hypothetical protein
MPSPTLADLVSSPVERLLIVVSVGLLLLSLAATLMR